MDLENRLVIVGLMNNVNLNQMCSGGLRSQGVEGLQLSFLARSFLKRFSLKQRREGSFWHYTCVLSKFFMYSFFGFFLVILLSLFKIEHKYLACLKV